MNLGGHAQFFVIHQTMSKKRQKNTIFFLSLFLKHNYKGRDFPRKGEES